MECSSLVVKQHHTHHCDLVLQKLPCFFLKQCLLLLIIIYFKKPITCICTDKENHKPHQNILSFRIQPNEGISLRFWAKKPGFDMSLEQKNLSFFLGSGQVFRKPARFLKEGDKVDVGECDLEIIEVPGHTPGSICLFTDGVLFSGDSLFAGSIGRTDFLGGNHDLLVKMIFFYLRLMLFGLFFLHLS